MVCLVIALSPLLTKLTAMTLGAGVQWHEAYDAVQARGRVLVGGLSAAGSVGAAGGWLLGGGHGALSPSYGLGNATF
jgi:FAD/FMN-containing dehydrogenase